MMGAECWCFLWIQLNTFCPKSDLQSLLLGVFPVVAQEKRCLGARRARQIHRALRHFKVTILCLVMTIVVLRGTIGAGKFGTPEQDFLLVDEEDDSEKPDPKKPYSLGPKISDWDEQRSTWLEQNPNFPNFIGPNKPRVLLVTGSSPKPCENPVGDHYLLKSIKNKIDYCRLHGIEIFYNMALLDAEMAGFWAKLPLIRKLLLSHPEVEFLWWMDSDAMFTDMAFELPWERYKDYNFVMHGWNEMVYDQKNWIGLNTGSQFLKLMISQQWCTFWLRRRIRGAEMIENYHPGLGDHRWPLVTHFVGCKPCGKFGDYPVERCLKQMDRAFNFGDNQVLQIYGFTHKSLGSRRVKRTRNDTNNPLEVKDELGLLHPAFKAVKVSSS
ncbi:unnamed protein product, partial [Vitis vinifera]